MHEPIVWHSATDRLTGAGNRLDSTGGHGTGKGLTHTAAEHTLGLEVVTWLYGFIKHRSMKRAKSTS